MPLWDSVAFRCHPKTCLWADLDARILDADADADADAVRCAARRA